MGNYVGKVGGSKWTGLVADQQHRNRSALKDLRQLETVAATDATRLLIKRVQVALLENQAELVELLVIAKAEEKG